MSKNKKANSSGSRNSFLKEEPNMANENNLDVLNDVLNDASGANDTPATETDSNALDTLSVLSAELDNAMSESNVTSSVSEEQTQIYNNATADGAKKDNKSKNKLDSKSQEVLGVFNSAVKNLQTKTNHAIGYSYAIKKHSELARIVGYLTKTDSKIDFAKVKGKDSSNGNVPTYRLIVKNMAPAPMAGVMISSPASLLQLINTNEKNDIQKEEVEKILSDKSKTLTYLSKSALHDFLSTKCESYVIEAEELFVPFHKLSVTKSQSVEVKSCELWKDPNNKKYAKTGGCAGIFAGFRTRAKLKDSSNSKERYKSITSTDQLEIICTLTNTARPKLGIAPGNYIASTKFDTINVKNISIADAPNAVEWTRRYFDRWTETSKPENRLNKHDVASDSIIKFDTAGDSLAVNCFNPSNKDEFWNNVKVEHWYDVDVATKSKKTIPVTDIELINRMAHKSSNDGNVVYRVNKFHIGSDEYPWQIPEKIRNAAEANGVLDDITLKAVDDCINVKTTSNNTTKLSSNIHITGYTRDELMERIRGSIK